jgi:NADPH:quinone reductase-like Zn-dependent oxidoreductase
MKAIVFTKYGSPDVLQLLDVEKPVPNDDDVLVKVRAASINAADYHSLSADIILVRLVGGGLFKPKDTRLGIDEAGQVEAVGKNIKQFKPGDEVYGGGRGSLAEYACSRETSLVLKPGNLTFEQAAAVPVAALTALQGLRDKGQIRSGQKVLIQGASGGVGMFAVQIAKSFGADVTAVCSTRNLENARSLGAEQVIDYTHEDFTKNGQQYDLIFAVNGYHPLSAYKRALTLRGRYVAAGGFLSQMLQAMLLGRWMSSSGGQTMGFMGIAKFNQQDLTTLKELLEAGKVVPVIDGSYPLSETANAFRYVEDVHPRGKVVITMAQS